MFNSKKIIVLFGAALIALLASCNFNTIQKKSGNVVFDFSSISDKVPAASRSIVDDLLADNQDCFVDLTLDGDFKYNQTINLRETQLIQVQDIPVGSRVKAIIEVYLITKIEAQDEAETEAEETQKKEILFNGESQVYQIVVGPNIIEVPLAKYGTDSEGEEGGENGSGEGNGSGGGQQEPVDTTIRIWVKYLENKQGGDTLNIDTKDLPAETEGNDGQSYNTAFNYIQSAINWIAKNGDGSKNYEIMLTDHTDGKAFNQCIVFGDPKSNYDNLRNKAKSIKLTSNNLENICINTNSYNSIIIATEVPVIFETIKIATSYNCSSSEKSLIIKTVNDDADLTLGQDSSLIGLEGNRNGDAAGAIRMEAGKITMTGNSSISGFNAYDGGAVYIDYGQFTMKDNSVISNCKATRHGGAFYLNNLHNQVILKDNAKISGCTAKNNGGAIYQHGGTVTIESGTIENCEAGENGGSGGAVYLDTGHSSPKLKLKGGTIKNNKATNNGNGAAIYVKEKNSSQVASLIMYDNACIDLSNDIYTIDTPIKLGNTLTTSSEKAAIITLYKGSTWNYAISVADSVDVTQQDTQSLIQDNFSKFYVQKSGLNDDLYIDQNGLLQTFDTTNYLGTTDTITIGDIVFADNSRVHADQLPYLSKRLRDSIAGIVFYAQPETNPIVDHNLIVGINSYYDKMSTSTHGSSGFTMFDRSSLVKDSTSEEDEFPGSSSRTGSYYEIRDSSSAVEIANAIINSPTTSGNERLNYGYDWTDEQIQNYHNKITYTAVQEIMQKINNNQTSSYPLYQKIFEHGKNFDNNSKYRLNTDDSNITDNWYIPTIAELKLFYDALNDSTFSNIYTTLCGNLSDYNYFSGSAIIGQGATYPDMYRYNSGNNTYYYAYYYTIDFTAGLIKCDPSNQSLYAIPVHVYVPGE